MNNELEELLSFIPSNNSEINSKLVESINDLKKQKEILTKYNELVKKDNINTFMNDELEELLSFIPSNNSEINSKLVECFNYDLDKQEDLLNKYNELIQNDSSLTR